jgi:hypothetical protein
LGHQIYQDSESLQEIKKLCRTRLNENQENISMLKNYYDVIIKLAKTEHVLDQEYPTSEIISKILLLDPETQKFRIE